MTAEPMPDWLRPPVGGFTAEDLDRLPDLPPHTELLDGSLVFVSPQTAFHLLTMDVLVNGLRRCAPKTVRVRREMTVTIDQRQRPEPDILLVNASAASGMRQTNFRPADVLLVAEVMSPDSVSRDRERKPQLYAQAGVRHFWRIEDIDERPVVHVYELDAAAHAYALAGIHHDQLVLTVPFDIDIDLTELDKL